jgi:hypothetical protein
VSEGEVLIEQVDGQLKPVTCRLVWRDVPLLILNCERSISRSKKLNSYWECR